MTGRFFAGKLPKVLRISSNQASGYNIFTQAGNPAAPTNVVLIIAPGVYVSHLATGSGWAAGSTIRIQYAGASILGPGGNGANGRTFSQNPLDGADGGDALVLGWDVILDHGGTGSIFGGGGGGAAGYASAAAGGGGGGGQGYPGGTGGTGTGGSSAGGNGNYDGPGTAGANGDATKNAGKGGAWGSDGKDSTGARTAVGGAKGRAIATNGRTVTWVGGMPGSAYLKGLIG
jgi:hypothetical protein